MQTQNTACRPNPQSAEDVLVHAAFFDHFRASTTSDMVDCTFGKVFDNFFAVPFVGADKTKIPVISFARFKPCPDSGCLGDPDGVDCKRIGAPIHRLKANAAEVYALGLDIDKVQEAVFAQHVRGVMARGLGFVLHTTYSHTPGSGLVRARMILPFVVPFPVAHPAAWSEFAFPMLLRALGLERTAVVDLQTKDASRIFALPSHPPGALGHESYFHPGAALDWRLHVDLSRLALPEFIRGAPSAPDTDAPVDLEDVRRRLRRIRREKWRPLISKLLAGEPLVTKAERDARRGLARENAWQEVTAALAIVRKDGEHRDAFLELCRASHAAGAADDPTGHTTWAMIVDRFDRACRGAPAWKADLIAKERARREHALVRLKALSEGNR